jgi:tRNA G18 (ribose-2'-O)-methylase SpoU
MRLKSGQTTLIATTLDPTATPLDRDPGASRLALLFGTEAHGLADPWIALCDRQVTIPMKRGTDSLNVAVAAGIVLYHYCVVNMMSNSNDLIDR